MIYWSVRYSFDEYKEQEKDWKLFADSVWEKGKKRVCFGNGVCKLVAAASVERVQSSVCQSSLLKHKPILTSIKHFEAKTFLSAAL